MDPSEQQHWNALGNELDRQALPRARSLAEKWGTTVSALAGLSTILAVLQGQDKIVRLCPGAEIAVACLLGLALLAAVVAIFSAASAAQGGITTLSLNDPDSVKNWYEGEISKVKRNLRVSRIATPIAVVLLFAAILVMWFGPTDPPVGERQIVITTFGEVRCGKLETDGSGMVMLDPDGSETAMMLENVANLVPVSECPNG